MKYNRGKISKMLEISSFEMVDFYEACPYIFEGELLKTRKQEVVIWRNIGMLWNWMSGKSLQAAGKDFGRDHSTVIHAIKQVLTTYEGYGYQEIKENIELIKEKSRCHIKPVDDINVNELKNLVLLENRISKLLKLAQI
jgi:hypothetical protein